MTTTTTTRARIPTRNRSRTNRTARANERVIWGVGGCICMRRFVISSLLAPAAVGLSFFFVKKMKVTFPRKWELRTRFFGIWTRVPPQLRRGRGNAKSPVLFGGHVFSLEFPLPEQRETIVFWGRRARIVCTAVAVIRRVTSTVADAGRLPVGDDRRFVGIFVRRTGASRLERR